MNKAEILDWLEKHNTSDIKCKYTINDDISIDVKGDVTLVKIPDGRIPEGIKFNIVNGDFECYGINLTSLEGCPEKVSGDFDCSENKLTTLEGCPKEVGDNFYCFFNMLTSLKGCPEKVGNNFCCCNNELTSIKGSPKVISGTFDCTNNKLTSLEGAPEKVRGSFFCNSNLLLNLTYMPVIGIQYVTDFTDKEVKVEQDIMKEAKTYEEGVEAYREYIDIFGDE